MIVNPEWLKPKEKPYFHQISMDCLKKLVECQEKFNKGEIDALQIVLFGFMSKVRIKTALGNT